ncbi:MAG: aminotransferase class I/II-fold pyridoxal phosphate-dependent enzyme, partial [Myxococcales bacterium]|nr:aminotransferase class I/II-fold pyridoxal phosphate-dependent enzyme [Myxococcales bacterium]
MLKLAESHIMSMTPYVPGHIGGELGGFWAELASNENCLGPSQAAMEAIKKSVGFAHLYPNNKRAEVIKKICQHLSEFSITPDHVALGNGTTEIIVNLVRGLVSKKEAIMSGWPTFIMYQQAAIAQGVNEVKVDVLKDMSFDLEAMLKRIHQKNEIPIKVLFLANPNNPTGNYINEKDLDDFIAKLPSDLVLIMDEAYSEYVVAKDYPNALKYIHTRPRTIVLRTMSKIYALAGMRLGFAVGDKNIIDILCR